MEHVKKSNVIHQIFFNNKTIINLEKNAMYLNDQYRETHVEHDSTLFVERVTDEETQAGLTQEIQTIKLPRTTR